MADTIKWTTTGLCLLFCLIYLITAIVSLNCLADKKNDCAQQSGFVALVFGCVALMAAGAAGWAWTKT